MDDAFEYIQKYGLTSEQNYQYTAMDGTCNEAKQNEPVAHISNHADVTANSKDALIAAIVGRPVSVAVDAASLPWQFYSGGVIERFCGTSLDHGVLAVGYDTTASSPFYWVKNSWGSGWGISGYLKIGIKDGDGVCGIQMSASYPIA